VLAYLRHDAAHDDSVLVLVNRDGKEAKADFVLPAAWSEKPVADELSGTSVTVTAGHIALPMAPESVRILSLSSRKAGS
jgi:hypothetical protein